MRIEVTVKKKATPVSSQIGGPRVAVSIEVDVCGDRNYYLEKELLENELKSNFDIVWGYIGKEIKEKLEKQ